MGVLNGRYEGIDEDFFLSFPFGFDVLRGH